MYIVQFAHACANTHIHTCMNARMQKITHNLKFIVCRGIFKQRKRIKSSLPGSSIYLCWHWLSGFISKGWAPSVAGHSFLYLSLVPYTFQSLYLPYMATYTLIIGWSVTGSWQSHACMHRHWLCHVPFRLFWEDPYNKPKHALYQVPGSKYLFAFNIHSNPLGGAIAAAVAWKSLTPQLGF